MSGWSTTARSIVGTAARNQGRSVSTRSSSSAGVEARHDHEGRPPRKGAEGGEHAPAGVEQGHRAEPWFAVGDAEAVSPAGGVVDDAGVAQHGPFGEAGGAAGVLDLDDVVAGDGGQFDVGGGSALVGFAQQVEELVESEHLAERGQVGAHVLEVGGERVAACVGDEEDARRFGLGEDVGELGGLEAGVDGDEGEAGEGGAVFDDQPLSGVRRPHGDPLAGPEAAQEHAGAALGVGEQLGVGPAAAGRRIGGAFDECGAVGDGGGDVAQELADGEVEAQRWAAAVGNPVRRGERCGGRDGHEDSLDRWTGGGQARSWTGMDLMPARKVMGTRSTGPTIVERG